MTSRVPGRKRWRISTPPVGWPKGRGTTPDRQQAAQAMGEAIRLWKEIEFNPELARTYVSYARLLQGWGQKGQARAYLTEAIAMFQEMGMDWDFAQAQQMLASTLGHP